MQQAVSLTEFQSGCLYAYKNSKQPTGSVLLSISLQQIAHNKFQHQFIWLVWRGVPQSARVYTEIVAFRYSTAKIFCADCLNNQLLLHK